MKLQEKLKCTTKCITHQEGIIVGQDAALHDALAQNDAVAAADQRQVRGQPPLRQQAAQQASQAADPGQAPHRAGQGRTTTNRASNEASCRFHNHGEGSDNTEASYTKVLHIGSKNEVISSEICSIYEVN